MQLDISYSNDSEFCMLCSSDAHAAEAHVASKQHSYLKQ